MEAKTPSHHPKLLDITRYEIMRTKIPCINASPEFMYMVQFMNNSDSQPNGGLTQHSGLNWISYRMSAKVKDCRMSAPARCTTNAAARSGLTSDNP